MDWTDGRAVYASGTAFPAITRLDGSQYVPSQANNSLIFPGKSISLYCSMSTCILTEDCNSSAVRQESRQLRDAWPLRRVTMADAHVHTRSQAWAWAA